jgi:hypothetical protein
MMDSCEKERSLTFKRTIFDKSYDFKSIIRLQIITIDNCEFRDNFFKIFVSSILKCVTLGWIFLTHNNLTDEDLDYIIDKIHEFKCLTCINLTGNLISQCGAEKLCDNIFRCPTLTNVSINEDYLDINRKILCNLKNNIHQISKFHSMVLENRLSENAVKLSFFPTLINSFDNGRTLLHKLVVNQMFTEILHNILKYNPNPYQTDICRDKIPLEIAKDSHKEILIEYMNLYNKNFLSS